MISVLLKLAVWALRVVGLAVFVYCVLSFVLPHHAVTRHLQDLIQPVLAPLRAFLHRLFPSLRRLGVDLTPLALWLMIDLAVVLLNSLRRAL